MNEGSNPSLLGSSELIKLNKMDEQQVIQVLEKQVFRKAKMGNFAVVRLSALDDRDFKSTLLWLVSLRTKSKNGNA